MIRCTILKCPEGLIFSERRFQVPWFVRFRLLSRSGQLRLYLASYNIDRGCASHFT
jgi:hypothetical protein